MVSLGEGMSPLTLCPRLGAALGLDRLWIKDESQLPTGSFKSRGLCMAVSRAKELGLRLQEILLEPGEAPTPGIKAIRAKDLKRKHFAPKLRRSHVITVIGPRDPDLAAHTVVVYGVDKFSICYMDPLLDPSVRSCTSCENRNCDRYNDFPSGFGGGPRYLLVWK